MDPLWVATELVSGIVSPLLSESCSAPGAPTLYNGHPADASPLTTPIRIKIFLYALLRDIEFTLDENIVIEKRVK